MENVKWLYYHCYYDGPITGAVEIDGKMYFALAIDQNDEPNVNWYRKYCIFDLPVEIWGKELQRQNLFRELCGSHFDFRDSQQKYERKENHKYYEIYPPDVELFDIKSYKGIGIFYE